MADTSKPVISGFRFNPFDQELIDDYLKPMIMGQQLPCNIIKFRQVYGPTSHAWRVFDPNEHNSWLVAPHLKDTEKVMFVFAKLSKLSKGGACKNYSKRAGCGTWVGKTKRDQIRDGEGHVIGEKRYLVYEIKEAVGVGFDFSKVGYYKMHEYSLSGVNQGLDGAGSIVLCKITYDSSKKCPVALMSGSKIADHDSTSGSVVCKTPSDSSKRCPIALMSGTKIADHDTTTSTSVLCETASDSSEECPITLKSVTKNIADHDTTTSTVLCTFDSSRELPITLMSGTKIADDVSTSTSSEAQEEEENYKNLEGMGIGSVTENPIVIDDGVGDWNDAAAQFNNGVQELYDFSGGISFDDLGGEYPCFDDLLAGGEDPLFGDLGSDGVYFDDLFGEVHCFDVDYLKEYMDFNQQEVPVEDTSISNLGKRKLEGEAENSYCTKKMCL